MTDYQDMTDYHDRWIDCVGGEIRIRGYYFPWGTKRIPYSSVRRLERVQLSAMRGQFRIWGTANPRYWASFDPRRRSRRVGFVVDLGKAVSSFVTPDDPDAFESAVRDGARLGTPPESRRGPIV